MSPRRLSEEARHFCLFVGSSSNDLDYSEGLLIALNHNRYNSEDGRLR